ncbi:MAG: hypothetical protein KGZ43_06390 [Sulfuritalea sp.]|nr:hypothetical protein [Sulfuritalea sp.]
MKSSNPMILPWLAHKAGIPERRAEILWHAAQRHAAHATGETETPAYWQAAMDRLLELVAAESLREDAASFGWRQWTRHHKRAWAAPLAILDALTLNSVRGWRMLRPLQLG